MGKHCGSLWCWGTPEVTVIGQGRAGGCEWVSLGCSLQRGEAVVLFYLSVSRTSFTPLPADGTLSLAGCLKSSSTGRKEVEAAGAEINTVLLSTGQLVWPHQVFPGASPPTEPIERCSWPSRVRDVEAERGVEVQEAGNGGGEHPCSWELPGRQVGSSLWFSSSLDIDVGQLALARLKGWRRAGFAQYRQHRGGSRRQTHLGSCCCR